MFIKNGRITTNNDRNYIAKIGLLADSHIGHSIWNGNYDRFDNVANKLNNQNVDFSIIIGDCIDSGYSWTQETMEQQLEILNTHLKKFKSPIFKMKGNHDAAVSYFTEFGSVIFNGQFKLICIWPKYVGMISYDEVVSSRGRLDENEIAWIESELQSAQNEGLTPIVLSHYCIHTIDENFKWPICDVVSAETEPATQNGQTYDGHRDDLVALLNEYNVPLFINGHEHRKGLVHDTVDNINTMNVQIGNTYSAYVVLTIYNDRFVFIEYDSATGNETGYTLEIPIS